MKIKLCEKGILSLCPAGVKLKHCPPQKTTASVMSENASVAKQEVMSHVFIELQSSQRDAGVVCLLLFPLQKVLHRQEMKCLTEQRAQCCYTAHHNKEIITVSECLMDTGGHVMWDKLSSTDLKGQNV